MSVTDINGQQVVVGSLVNVISLDPKDFARLDLNELGEVMSLVGEVLEVEEIDEYGQAYDHIEEWCLRVVIPAGNHLLG